MKHLGLWITTLIIALLIAGYFVFNHFFLYTRVAYVNARTIIVSSQIPGKLAHVYVKDLQPVTSGQLLVSIDDASYQANLKLAEANLQQVMNSYDHLKEKLAAQQLLINRTQSQETFLAKKWQRYQSLLNSHAVAPQQAEEIHTAYIEITQSLKSMQGLYDYLQNTIGNNINDYAPYKSALSAVKIAQINEDRTQITSPIGGYVTSVQLAVGNYVKTGQPLMIVIDNNDWWVTANVLEDDLRGIRNGDKAYITLPALGKTFTTTIYGIGWGVNREDRALNDDSTLPYIQRKVDWIQLQQRFPIRFNFTHLTPEDHLRLGETAHVFLIKHYGK